MNRLIPLRIRTSVLLALMALATVGCGDTACEELGEVCPYCADTTYRQSCEELVADELDNVCDTQMSTFQTVCPQPR